MAQPYPGYGYAPPYGYPAAPMLRRRTAFITLAQVLVIIQSALVILAGIGLAVGGQALSDYLYTQYGITTAGGATTYVVFGLVLLLLGAIYLIAGIRLGKPSQWARWTIVVIESLVLLSGVLTLTRNGAISFGPILSISVAALIIYGLTVDSNTRRAFAGRPPV